MVDGTQISGTAYRWADGSILDPEGRAVSLDTFVSKVESGQIRLNEAALHFLGERVSADVLDRLRTANQGKPQNDPPKPSANGSGWEMPDFRALQAIIDQVTQVVHEAANKLRIAARKLELADTQDQVRQLHDAASTMRKASALRLGAGIATGVVGMASGGINIKGALKADAAVKPDAAGPEVKPMDLDADTKGLGLEPEGPKVEADDLALDARTLQAEAPGPKPDAEDVDPAAMSARLEDFASGEMGEMVNAARKIESNKILQQWGGIAEVLKATGSVGTSSIEYFAALDDERAKKIEAGTKLTEYSASGWRETRDVAREVSNKMESLAENVERARAEMDRSARSV